MRAWATVGYFDGEGDGQMVELDCETGTVREVLRVEPPEDLRVPSKGLTGACWMGEPGQGDLLVCGAAAVFRFDAMSLELAGVLTQPSFNDLHGLHLHEDRLYVANTGLDCIDVFDIEGQFLGSHGFESPWLMGFRLKGQTPTREDWRRLRRAGWTQREEAFAAEQPSGDYYNSTRHLPFRHRKQRDFVHLNHVFVLNERVLVTSLTRRGVIDIGAWRQVCVMASPTHDGQVFDGGLWVTRVEGVVECRSVQDLDQCILEIDVSQLTGITGWCRGLLVTDDAIWVGFTEMRRPASHPWNRSPFELTTTAVAVLDRSTLEVLCVFNLSEAGRHSKIFCILEAPP